MRPLLEAPIQTARHALLLLPGMPRVIASLEHDVGGSRQRVFVETYVYHDHKFGRGFARDLAGAARRGASVRLLYDALGSHVASASFFEGLHTEGVATRAYRPLEVVAQERAPFPRDHSRVIVTDSAAYTGGAAWGDNWLPRRLGGEGWYDVCARVQGPVVEDFASLFEQRWREANGDVPPADFATEHAYPDLELVGDTPDRDSLIEDRHRRAFQAAKKRIWIENAYFFPTESLLRDLHAAAARGVDVQILLPGESDLAILRRAARSEYQAWCSSGLQVFEYRATMLHSKLALVDDTWCTVGSFNMNPTSVAWANEVALFVFDRAFVARVAAQFEADRALSRHVLDGDAARSPPLLQRAADRLAAWALRIVERKDGILPQRSPTPSSRER